MNFIFLQHISKKGTKLFLMLALGLQGFLLLVSPVQGQGPPGVPATYYGVVQAGSDFVPKAGMTVTAYVNGALCGESQTESRNGEIVYQINVMGAGPDDNGCGSLERSVTLFIESQEMAALGRWDNSQVHEVNLNPVDTQATINSVSSSSSTLVETQAETETTSPSNTPIASNTETKTETTSPSNTPTANNTSNQGSIAQSTYINANADNSFNTPLTLLAAIALAFITGAGTLLIMRR